MRIPPTQLAISVIQQEHDLLYSVINAMQRLARSVSKGGEMPDLRVFRAMLYYIKEFPDRVHHPKEDHSLFARLRGRSADVDTVIDELEAQHAQGNGLVASLEHALAHCELEGSNAFPEFADMIEHYVDFYMRHMRMEEHEILPAAVRLLSADDWRAVNAAFADNQHPLADPLRRKELDNLFTRIVHITPAPIGVGPALCV